MYFTRFYTTKISVECSNHKKMQKKRIRDDRHVKYEKYEKSVGQRETDKQTDGAGYIGPFPFPPSQPPEFSKSQYRP